jgi:hypothetical protein
VLRALRAFQSSGIIKPGGCTAATPAGATPASPLSGGVVLYDRAAAAFQVAGLIPRPHSSAATLKSPSKNAHALDAAAPSPSKLSKSCAKATLCSPDKRPVNTAKCATVERSRTSKVLSQRNTFSPGSSCIFRRKNGWR